MSNKNKGGREVKKPKAAKNLKETGQTPAPRPVETGKLNTQSKG